VAVTDLRLVFDIEGVSVFVSSLATTAALDDPHTRIVAAQVAGPVGSIIVCHLVFMIFLLLLVSFEVRQMSTTASFIMFSMNGLSLSTMEKPTSSSTYVYHAMSLATSFSPRRLVF
jgi:hypothetical protein